MSRIIQNFVQYLYLIILIQTMCSNNAVIKSYLFEGGNLEYVHCPCLPPLSNPSPPTKYYKENGNIYVLQGRNNQQLALLSYYVYYKWFNLVFQIHRKAMVCPHKRQISRINGHRSSSFLGHSIICEARLKVNYFIFVASMKNIMTYIIHMRGNINREYILTAFRLHNKLFYITIIQDKQHKCDTLIMFSATNILYMRQIWLF